MIYELKATDIVTIKMVGGDEIIGRVNAFNDKTVELSKPNLVVMAQQGFGLMPYILTAGPDVVISIDNCNIIAITKTLDQVAKQYIKQTSGLVL